MSWRGSARRTIPYLVTASGGFLLAYLIVAFFVFPARLVSSETPVPNVVGSRYEDAAKRLSAAGFSPAAGEKRYHLTAPVRAVLSQVPPAGTIEPRGTRVILELSLGPRTGTVPAVTGLTQQQAELALVNAGLEVGLVTEAQDAAPRGWVLRTSPAAGAKVTLPSAVGLVVSVGPSTVTIPDVVGQDYPQARALLTQLGLRVAIVLRDTTSSEQPNSVVSQLPEANRTVASGTAVQLTIASPPR